MFGQGNNDDGFTSARGALSRNRGLYEMINDPTYSEFIPELLKNDSANYELINEDPLLRSAQMSALQKMSGLADTGLSDVDQAGYERARRLGGQIQKAGQGAALQNAQARGVAGSGLEFAMRESANQQAAERAQEAGLAQAADSAKQRALYQTAYGNALGQQRSQDMQAETANKGIINRFNEMNTQNRNQTNNANANLRNSAFQYNEGLKDKRFNNELTRADRTSGLNNRSAEIDAAQAAARRAQDERDRARSGALLGAAGGIVGGFYGGAGGATAGAAAGQAIGGSYG